MNTLNTSLRTKLENTVKEARDLAEEAAKAAIEQIGVHLKEKPTWLDNEQARLRVRLRAHGRQLGDIRYTDGRQEINHLITETAYEHWHRMLFARFLAENHLLIHPDGVPVSLQDCEELAVDESTRSGWELAGRYASRMLPQVFRTDSPVLDIILAPEHQKGLEKLLSHLESEVFPASDSLGWVYQFWQAKRKDEVNKSEVKIGADELPAVTQLFTEPYMVQFLLHNSLGAWWVSNHPGEEPPVQLAYLRILEDGTPAAGAFEGWPKRLADLKMLDPCMGSGHFLVTFFLMLVPMRMKEEGLTPQGACDAVIRDNIHGLEIDSRCTEIAAFTLALAAWTYPDAGGYRPLPEMNLACCGLPVSASKDEWMAFANGNSRLQDGMAILYKLFDDAPILGSLINPRRFVQGDIVTAGYDELKPLLDKALEREDSGDNSERKEIGVAARGLSRAAALLGETYHLIATNVPYLVRGRQTERLKSFCDSHYTKAKNDLATVFLERCLEFCKQGGTSSLVLPQNWLFLTTYKKLREKLLKKDTWNILARLGPGAFDTITGEVVQAILVVLTVDEPQAEHLFNGLDASELKSVEKKVGVLRTGALTIVSQQGQLYNPALRVLLNDLKAGGQLNELLDYFNGIVTGDFPRFGRVFWEIIDKGDIWNYQQTTVDETCFYGGMENLMRWEKGTGEYWNFLVERLGEEGVVAWCRGLAAHGRKGIAVRGMSHLPAALYAGTLFDNNITVLIPNHEKDLPGIWAFVSSYEYNPSVRQINPKVSVTDSAFVDVTFDSKRWNQAANEMYPQGLPKPFTDNGTQWIFHSHPCGSVVWDEKKKWTALGQLRIDSSVLQVAVARLLGYRWPAETDESIELASEAHDLANKCKELYSYADDDGIVCIPSVRGEKPAAERLVSLLAAAYGDAWSATTLSDLLASVECVGKTVEVWLRDKFFEQHFKLFHHRPFIWQIWDGQRDGFSALVNYHRLTRQNLEKLVYTYLGDWINRQEDAVKQAIEGAQVRLLVAQKLKSDLEKILEGEKPYDIFVRWKPLHKQPIGWEPDLNDGVRLNIRPFMTAGVLRKNPNIKWNKDRGKDVESAPWYHLFKGDRINDYHLGLAEKKAVRERI